MGIVQIDWLNVVVGALANMLIGMVWYSKSLFGTLWGKLVGTSISRKQKMLQPILLSALVSLTTACLLAIFQGYLGITTVTDGMYVAFLAWVGFSLTTEAQAVIWEKKPILLFYINTGYKLLAFLVMGGIIGA